jgi:hypothetical protein
MAYRKRHCHCGDGHDCLLVDPVGGGVGADAPFCHHHAGALNRCMRRKLYAPCARIFFTKRKRNGITHDYHWGA